MRRGSILALLGIGTLAGGLATAVALLPRWLPLDASRERGRIDFVFWFMIVICIAIFALVVAVMVYSIVKFRAAPDDERHLLALLRPACVVVRPASHPAVRTVRPLRIVKD